MLITVTVEYTSKKMEGKKIQKTIYLHILILDK